MFANLQGLQSDEEEKKSELIFVIVLSYSLRTLSLLQFRCNVQSPCLLCSSSLRKRRGW